MPESDIHLFIRSSARSNVSILEPWSLPIDGQVNRRDVDGQDWLFDRVRAPSADVRRELVARGFVFRDHPRRGLLLNVLRDAEDLLSIAPRLELSVRAGVDEIVLLKARPDFDISHSEPRWPQTVFVSVPSRADQVNALRAAENIVHEAMHLQLTLLENADPLVDNERSKMTSPWRGEPRHLRGVLHGFYVFTCIAAFFDNLGASGVLTAEGTHHVGRRQTQIAEELSQVDREQLASGLTVGGRSLLQGLSVGSRLFSWPTV
jgi:HEXXH motif-containing protein